MTAGLPGPPGTARQRDSLVLVLAARDDVAACTWARRDQCVRVVTPRDLSLPGWTLRDGRATGAMVDGRRVDLAALRGVVVRLPVIAPDDLPWVAAEDRDYAAAECTAFLTAWLLGLEAPVLNPPRGGLLCGTAAADAIAHARAPGRDGHRPGSSALVEAHFVDGALVHSIPRGGGSTPALDRARRLARQAGLPLCRVRRLDGPAQQPWTLDPWIDVGNGSVATAVLDALDRRAAVPRRARIRSLPRPRDRTPRRNTVVLWGRMSDAPVLDVHDALLEHGGNPVLLDDRTTRATFGKRAMPVVSCSGEHIKLGHVLGFYFRSYCTEQAAPLAEWIDTAPITVINRPRAMWSNSSKPFQAALIQRVGIAIPTTLVTTDVATARRFVAEHGEAIYKSTSAIRSIAGLVRPDDRRLARPLACPTQFQARIPGPDLRVHVVGNKAFGTLIRSEAVDYRYAARSGAAVEMTPAPVPHDLADRLIALCRDLDLVVAGADLRKDRDGSWVCFEINPSPAFSFFDRAAHHGAIASSIASALLA